MNAMSTEDPTLAVRARGLGLTYRHGLFRRRPIEALRGCDLALPIGTVTALVGANGAGKSTLLSLMAGLTTPDAGTVCVRGRTAFVAQDKPLYRHLDAETMGTVAARTNRCWDAGRAGRWLDRFEVPRRRACGRLSGGQRTLVALALAVGSVPDVLLLDEPLADLDPLVRREVSAALLDEAAERGITVLLSTHVVADLVGVADHLLVLAGGRVLLDGDTDDLQAGHREYVGPGDTTGTATPPVDGVVVDAAHHGSQSRFVVRLPERAREAPVAERWTATPLPLDDLVNAYLATDRRADPA